MQIFKNRPLALFCCALSASAVWALQLTALPKAMLALLALILSLLCWMLSHFLSRVKKLMLYGVCVLLGCGVAFSSSYLFFDVYFEKTQEGVGAPHRIEGVVLERGASTSFSSSFRVKLLSLDGEENTETVLLTSDYASPLQLGNYFAIDAYQDAIPEDGDYNEKASLLSEGCTRIFVSEDWNECVILPEQSRDFRVMIRQWNQNLSSRLSHAISDEEGALSTALLLGNRSYLSMDTTLSFRRAGISHLLALSGMHVSVLAGFLELLLRRLRISKRVRAIFVPVVLVGYLLLTGASASTVRAVVMVGVLYLGFLLRADYDSCTAVCIVPAGFLLLTPYAVYDLSLWMSFLAAFSIIVFHPAIRTVGLRIRGAEHPAPLIRRILAWIFEAISVGVVANAGLLLLTSAVFGETSLVSVPATILLSFPMSVLLILAIPALAFPSVGLFSFLCQKVSGLMLFAATWFSDMKNVLVSTSSEAERWMLIFFTAVLIVLAVFKIRRVGWFLAVPTCMVAILVTSVCITHAMPEKTYAVEAGVFDFVAAGEGGVMTVYDYSSGFGYDVLAVISVANEVRCTELETLYICKYDNRRPYLLAHLSGKIKVRNLSLPKPQNEREHAIASRLAQEAILHGINVQYRDLVNITD